MAAQFHGNDRWGLASVSGWGLASVSLVDTPACPRAETGPGQT